MSAERQVLENSEIGEMTREELKETIDERIRTGKYRVVDAGMKMKDLPKPSVMTALKKNRNLLVGAATIGFAIAWELRGWLNKRNAPK